MKGIGIGATRITKVLNKKEILINWKRIGKLLHGLGLYEKAVPVNTNDIIENWPLFTP